MRQADSERTDRLTTIKQAASEMEKAMTKDTRNDGATYWHLRDGSPEWMTQAAHDAHGDIMPDDHRYEFILDALAVFSEADDDATEDDLRERIDEIEADIYTHDLTNWLGSRTDRFGYVDAAVEEYGHSEQGIIGDIMLGQMAEKRETAELLLTALIAQVEVTA